MSQLLVKRHFLEPYTRILRGFHKRFGGPPAGVECLLEDVKLGARILTRGLALNGLKGEKAIGACAFIFIKAVEGTLSKLSDRSDSFFPASLIDAMHGFAPGTAALTFELHREGHRKGDDFVIEDGGGAAVSLWCYLLLASRWQDPTSWDIQQATMEMALGNDRTGPFMHAKLKEFLAESMSGAEAGSDE